MDHSEGGSSGSGLTYRWVDSRSVALEPAPQAANDVVLLGSLRVEGAAGANGGGAFAGNASEAPFFTPGATNYISGKQIERFRGSSPADILRGTPGVMSGEARNSGALDVNIRGMQGMGRVAVSVDGAENAMSIYQGYQGMSNRTFVDPDLIAGIDITKLGKVVRHSDAVTGGAGAIMLRDTTAPVERDDPWYGILTGVRTLGEKDLTLALALGEELGVDLLFELPFDDAFAHVSAEGFVDDLDPVDPGELDGFPHLLVHPLRPGRCGLEQPGRGAVTDTEELRLLGAAGLDRVVAGNLHPRLGGEVGVVDPGGPGAGAVVSGSFFGDKISPLSDTTNLAPAVTGTTVFDHIRNMLPTTVPAMLIALLIFGVARGIIPPSQHESMAVWVLIIAIVYGLSTDYEVFLVSRMVEARRRGASTDESIAAGTAHTGGIITAAALIMIVVSGAFGFSDIVMMKYIAYGMIFALLIDATIVRMLLVPAVMHLLREDNWWAPSWLRHATTALTGGARHRGKTVPFSELKQRLEGDK